ncbi:ABC transporter ATP-binding protein [Nocardioides bigeumensis]|uniref:ABC transporter ATP-binding protein n=1 Tax=Nocardioides bigeumensis TaxID=433657 RepID=A0ABN2XKC2_9ACTN
MAAPSRPTTDEQTPVLEIEELHVTFRSRRRDVRAVRGVSLKVQRGEVLGIVGESGCGKSTTALAVTRLLPTTAEIVATRIRVAGVDLTSPSVRDLTKIRGAKVGMIFQDPTSSLNPSMTIGDQIAEPLRLHAGLGRAEAARAAAELLGRVGIADAQQRVGDYPHQLSGGQRQRVMIAIAVACTPDLILADEATTALDVTVQAEILDLLRGLQRDTGTALVFVSHDLGVVGDFADRVAVMYAGQIVELRDVRDLLSRPRHPYTAALLECAPRIGTARRLPTPILGGPPDLGRPVVGCAFRARCARVVERCATDDPGPELERIGAACWNPVSSVSQGSAS